MHLLDTNNITLTYFRSNVPDYAILSHVWEMEEVLFQDLADPNKARKMYGYAKITSACNTARQDGLKYIWIDTCCINKDSSAELSEAINSMYAWYKNARICYAYLYDVVSEGDPDDPHSLFALSHWFTRGWTLQELIAPPTVIFYAKDWVDIGTKTSLHDMVSSVTGISPEVIVGDTFLNDVPVAVRMSWAAKRKTTREEDIAYSLMGIFDVNMPLLYGEGKKAFIRLQYEIIKKSTDHSIFAWKADYVSIFHPEKYRGILARSPSEFRDSGNIESITGPTSNVDQTTHAGNIETLPYAITNRGLHIELPIAIKSQGGEQEILAFLNCRFAGKSEPIVITLSQPQPYFLQSGTYIRSDTMTLEQTSASAGPPANLSSIYIAENYSTPNDREPVSGEYLEIQVNLPINCSSIQINPIGCDNVTPHIPQHMQQYVQQQSFFTSFSDNPEAVLMFEGHDEFGKFAVISGIRKPETIWCNILSATEPGDSDEWNALNAYCTSSIDGGIQWRKKNRFLDRASRNLTYGWLVTVSTKTHFGRSVYSTGKYKLEIHIEATPQKYQQPAGLPEPPLCKDVFLVIPPAPEHGFVADINTPQECVLTSWVKHLGFVILYTENDEPGILTFRDTTSGEEFFLLVKPRHGAVNSTIEEKRPTDLIKGYSEEKSEYPYSVVLSQGKVVFVTARQYYDGAVPVNIINLSM